MAEKKQEQKLAHTDEQRFLLLAQSGLSIFPTQQNKSPDFSLIPRVDGRSTWSPFQEKIADAETIGGWLERGCRSIAIVGGRVSGQLVQLDFEGKDHQKAPMTPIYAEWRALARESLKDAGLIQGKPLSICQTPSGGFHVRWRVDTDETLACEPEVAARFVIDENGEPVKDEWGKWIKDKLVETKNEGGYCLCPPSDGYIEVEGDLAEIPTISVEVHQILMDAARSFHSAFDQPISKTERDSQMTGDRPGDDFNRRGDHHEILQRHGWSISFKRNGVEYWKHGQTQNSVSASWNYIPDRFFVFSTSTDFEPLKVYNRFSLYATLDHNSDFHQAAKALGEKGFGGQTNNIGRGYQSNETAQARTETTEEAEQVSIGTFHPILNKESQDLILLRNEIDATLAERIGYQCLAPVSTMAGVTGLCEQAESVFVIGEKGFDIAQFLFYQRYEVRIVELFQEGDLADFLERGGDFDKVLDDAAAFLEVWVKRIASQNGRKRTQAVNTLLATLKGFGPLTRDEGLAVMVDAKIGKLTTLRQQMKYISADKRQEQEADEDLRSHRKVTEQIDHYTAFNPETQGVDIISNFIIVPTLRVFLDDRESVVCDFVSADRTISGVTIERTDWNDKQRFMNVIPSVDFWFDGTLSQIQSVLAIVASYDVPTKQGVDKVGLHESSQTWVMPHGGFTDQGYQTELPLAYTPPGGVSEWGSILANPADEKRGFDEIREKIGALLPIINKPEIIWGAIGWFCATPYRNQLSEKYGGFPFLSVIGTRGTGKSSMLKVFARLFGYTQHPRLFSSSQTSFVLLRLFSSTSTVPVIVDEYKSDLPIKQRQMITRFIRRTYNGESEFRGNPDKTLTKYTLTAPIVLSGEIEITQPAMLDRMICLPVEPKGLSDTAKKAFLELNQLPLTAFFDAYTVFTLQNQFEGRYKKVKALFQDVIPDCPDRVRDNLEMMVFGMSQFADFMEIEISDEMITSTVEHALHALTDDGSDNSDDNGDEKFLVGFDQFLQHLASMAESGRISQGVHYERHEADGLNPSALLHIRFNLCFAEFLTFVRQTGIDDEVLTINAYRRQARENQLGYVLHTSKAQRWSDNEVRRCLSIDVELAEKCGIDLVGFSIEQPEMDIVL